MIEEKKLQRRVVGHHDIRMDGLTDLVVRGRDASVLDIGCNRGMVGFEFANNGATLIHGCDNYEPGIVFARELFIDLRNVKSRFEVVDLNGGGRGLAEAFGDDYPAQYDIVLMLATYHKIKRQMKPDALRDLMLHFAGKTGKYFAFRGRIEEMKELDAIFGKALRRIHTSHLSRTMEAAAAIWARD